ncbi:MAG: saccharopine dehydrogenase family protein [Pseudomonadales bacterium]
MQTIHWIGTGLSAIPGLRRLIEAKYDVIVYNRSVDKAQQAVGDLTDKIVKFDLAEMSSHVAAKDVVVSMLPGDFHVPLAKLCLENGAHFVSSSYISDEMRALDAQAKAAGLCVVNEVGLDPGLDHSMAHALIDVYRASEQFEKSNVHSFTSYCGGLSEQVNDFCYKFSWSPSGVLKALRNTSVSLLNGEKYTVTEPWNAVDEFPLVTSWGTEVFEVYPNRDSLPFIEQYHMNDGWNIDQFVRGTLRYKGWKNAWQPIFRQIEAGMDDAAIDTLSDQLWQDNALADGEADRVVLAVTLKAVRDGQVVWHQTYALDAIGDSKGSAMAKLVSLPVSLAIEAVIKGEIGSGVTAAPDSPELVERWLNCAAQTTEKFALIDHLK